MRAVEAGTDGIEDLVFGASGEQDDPEMVQEWWAQTDG
jgi:hypothetical protein